MSAARADLEYVSEAFAAIDDFERLNEAAAVMQRLAAALSDFGFHAFLITGMPFLAESLEPYVLINGWPDGWYARYMQANHYRHDPCARHCFTTTEPYTWTEVRYDPKRDPKAHQVMQEAADFGLKEGLSVPVHDASGFQACVTMAGERLDLPPKALRAVHLVALYGYGAARRVREANAISIPPWRLTAREKEVLRWTAMGKSAWEISCILEIAERTVVAHVQNARRKLGTTNGVHTVVEALRRGEIRV